MLDSAEIIAHRPPKNSLDSERPYHFLHEQETNADGDLQAVNTIFLTNNECPFKCIMCDLWKNTLDQPTPVKAIPHQIKYALNRLPEASVIKLYNSGNFFDAKAIPPDDYPNIAKLLNEYERVIVENHPKLCGPRCVEFRDLLDGSLEIAMGLETIHPDVLPKLNKQITKQNFAEAADYLCSNNIDMRAFILLNPPYLLGRDENMYWTLESVKFAFDCGATACSIIPTRLGNGMMEKLQADGQYIPPTLDALEEVFSEALALNRGRIFVDLWDLKQFSSCENCFEDRKKRLQSMNFRQEILPAINCHCEGAHE